MVLIFYTVKRAYEVDADRVEEILIELVFLYALSHLQHTVGADRTYPLLSYQLAVA